MSGRDKLTSRVSRLGYYFSDVVVDVLLLTARETIHFSTYFKESFLQVKTFIPPPDGSPLLQQQQQEEEKNLNHLLLILWLRYRKKRQQTLPKFELTTTDLIVSTLEGKKNQRQTGMMNEIRNDDRHAAPKQKLHHHLKVTTVFEVEIGPEVSALDRRWSRELLHRKIHNQHYISLNHLAFSSSFDNDSLAESTISIYSDRKFL